MKDYVSVLKKSSLFSGLGEEEIRTMQKCLDAKVQSYKKGSYVFRQGEHIDRISVLLEGELLVQQDDYWGNRSIVTNIGVGELFGEAYLAPESGTARNDIIASKDSTVVSFDVRRVITTCTSACRFHTKVVQNMFFAVSEKYRMLEEKLGHMSKRSTREKLISYLSEEARRQNSASITIPYNRQELADFLSVDRSAMSNELSKLRDSGMLCFEKNRFILLNHFEPV